MYKLTNTASILRMADMAVIPNDPANTDYQAYQVWLDAGNAPAPANTEPVVVPQSVLKRQGRAALIIAGHQDERNYIAEIEAHLAAMEGVEGELARDEWASSQAWERHRPLTIAMGQLLGFSAARMDELFIFAATL